MKKTSAPKDAQNKTGTKNITPPTKHELALYDLLKAGTGGISKLTELPSYGETCLPTTISELGKIGFVIARETRPHIHQYGNETRFTWYWLADRGEACKAVNRVNRLRHKRMAAPMSEILAERLLHGFPLPCDLGSDAA